MFGRRWTPRLEVELTSQGFALSWECSPGVVVRRRFSSVSLGCAAAAALGESSPRTLPESIALIEDVVRSHPASHAARMPRHASRHGRSNSRHGS
jgi:hypothetical protein